MKTKLKEEIIQIFNCDYDAEDYEPEGEMYDYAQEVISQYPWNEILQCTIEYFNEHSSNVEQVLNFIDLYVSSGFVDRPLDNPYQFVAIIASKVDFNADWDIGAERVENFLTCLLDMKGVISLYLHPYYQLHEDPRFLEALASIVKQEG